MGRLTGQHLNDHLQVAGIAHLQ
jgi:hypothetical protein